MPRESTEYDSATLEPILSIRRHRTERAEKDVRRYREQLIEAAHRSQLSLQKRDQWRQERPVRENRIFLAVKGKKVSKSRLSSTQQDMTALKVKERLLSEEATQREEERKQAMEKLDQAWAAYHQALRKVKKLEEVIQHLRVGEYRMEERSQEQEMEEFSTFAS